MPRPRTIFARRTGRRTSRGSDVGVPYLIGRAVYALAYAFLLGAAYLQFAAYYEWWPFIAGHY